jgi:hypothetical protein
MKFRKKPVVIEAFVLGVDDQPDWFVDKVVANEITTHLVNANQYTGPFDDNPIYCLINTLEGKMKGDYKDYIIQGVKGEIYPCKPDIFKDAYEEAE